MNDRDERIFEPGEIFAQRYDIERRIGIGGFGSVYRARDSNLRREVALKVLDVYESAPNPRAAQQIRKRFGREAMVAGTIQHPSIVQVYDAGATEHRGWECLFLVMELLEGWNLEDHLYRFENLEPSLLLPLYVQLLRGVAEGHRRKVIHKDLKPGNIFYHMPHTRDARLVVFDFGIARILHEERYTATGHLVGTPQYLAPEYIIDQTVTPRFDVYQLGLILCELLTGVPVVIPADSFIGTCQAHVTGLELPESILESPLAPVIKKSCAKEPEDRYADAGEFADALEALDTFDFSLGSESKDEVDERVDRSIPAPTLPISDEARDQIRADRSERGRDTHLFSPDTAETIRARLAQMRSESPDEEDPAGNDHQKVNVQKGQRDQRKEPTITADASPEPTPPPRPRRSFLVGVFIFLVVLVILGFYVLGAR